MTIEDKKYSTNLDPDNENKSLPDLKTIWECNKIIKLSSQWSFVGIVVGHFLSLMRTEHFIIAPRLTFHNKLALALIKHRFHPTILSNIRRWLRKNCFDAKKRGQVDLSHNISSTNERISQQLCLQKSNRLKMIPKAAL